MLKKINGLFIMDKVILDDIYTKFSLQPEFYYS